MYDSLAPLNIPSKPIVYLPEQQSSNTNKTTSENTEKKEDDSSLDERAKLESIMLNTMNASVAVGHNQFKTHGMNSIGNPGLSINRYTANMWPIPQQMQIRPLPLSYRCAICKKTGHPKNLCPDAGTLPKLDDRLKFPSGIPKAKMRPAAPDDKFAMLGPDGYVVPVIEYNVSKIVKKDKEMFLEEDENENKKLNSNFTTESKGAKYPPELKCPLGDHMMKDAVLVPCCGHFICCDECIKSKISNDESMECPHQDCDQEIGPLESITPYHQIRKMTADYLNDLKQENNRKTIVNQFENDKNVDPFFDSLLNDLNDSKPSYSEPKISGFKYFDNILK